jgi:hypothetical protein
MATDTGSHQIRNSIISGLILAAIISLLSVVPAGWSLVWNVLKAVWKWLTENRAVPGWTLVLLIACGAVVLVMLVFIGWTWITRSKSSPVGWKGYTEDEFFGLKWRWQYSQSGIYRLVCFCPACDQQLYPQNRSAFRALDRIGFRCDHCGRDLGEFDMNWDTLEDKVKRSVQRKVRTGEWSR